MHQLGCKKNLDANLPWIKIEDGSPLPPVVQKWHQESTDTGDLEWSCRYDPPTNHESLTCTNRISGGWCPHTSFTVLIWASAKSKVKVADSWPELLFYSILSWTCQTCNQSIFPPKNMTFDQTVQSHALLPKPHQMPISFLFTAFLFCFSFLYHFLSWLSQ